MQNSIKKGQNAQQQMLVQSQKQLARDNSNRSTTPQKAGVNLKKNVQYDNYQMAAGGASNKNVLSHQLISKQPMGGANNFQNQVKAGISGIGGPSGG